MRIEYNGGTIMNINMTKKITRVAVDGGEMPLRGVDTAAKPVDALVGLEVQYDRHE